MKKNEWTRNQKLYLAEIILIIIGILVAVLGLVISIIALKNTNQLNIELNNFTALSGGFEQINTLNITVGERICLNKNCSSWIHHNETGVFIKG